MSVHADLQRLEVARELRTHPTVRVVPVRGHQGLLFPRRPDNFYNGVIWEERPGVVVQVLGSKGVADQLLLDVAAGLGITETASGTVVITVGPRPPGWIKVGRGTRWPALGDYLTVLPRSHQQLFDKARGGTDAELVITETRGQYGPLRSADKRRLVPETRREAVTVHGYPALLDYDPINHFLEVTWREPGGIELTVHATRTSAAGNSLPLPKASDNPDAATPAAASRQPGHPTAPPHQAVPECPLRRRPWWCRAARPAPWGRTRAAAADRRRCGWQPCRGRRRGTRHRSGPDRYFR